MSHDTTLILHLHAALSYEGGVPSRPGPFDPAEGKPGATDRVLAFAESACVTQTGEGPRALDRFGKADFAGCLREPNSGAGSGAAFALAPGAYLFWQTRLSGNLEDACRDAIEFFAREAWWSGEETSGPYVIRLVDEDGHTALQIIRSLT